jgi:putative FmdB family regulatory protein
MPIYEYECQKCGERIEKIQKVADPPLEDCNAPECSAKGTLKKLISKTSFRLKGAGWAADGYGK